MNTKNYKKIHLAEAMLARYFFNASIPFRIPPVTELGEQYSVSRSIVFNAMNKLEDSGCITLEKCGRSGTFLVKKNDTNLYKYTDWNVITGTMPAPIELYLQGLATAICAIMGQKITPFSFAFISGAERRMDTLNRGLYDFSIVSAMSAAYFIKKYPDLQVVKSLYPAYYQMDPYVLLINKSNATGIEDGMSVLIDPYCYDLTKLTNDVCKGKRIHHVEGSFIGIEGTFLSGVVDAVVYRKSKWMNNLNNVTVLPIEDQEGALEPVLIVNSKNYGTAELLLSLMDVQTIARIQEEVVSDPSKARFY